MQRWEIKNHWLPLGLDKGVADTAETTNPTKTVDFVPTWNDDFKKAWAEAELLADDGWELVSAAPETGSRATMGVTPDASTAVALGWSFTAGYLLIFRRPKA